MKAQGGRHCGYWQSVTALSDSTQRQHAAPACIPVDGRLEVAGAPGWQAWDATQLAPGCVVEQQLVKEAVNSCLRSCYHSHMA